MNKKTIKKIDSTNLLKNISCGDIIKIQGRLEKALIETKYNNKESIITISRGDNMSIIRNIYHYNSLTPIDKRIFHTYEGIEYNFLNNELNNSNL